MNVKSSPRTESSWKDSKRKGISTSSITQRLDRSGGTRVSPPREHSRVGHEGEGGLSVSQESMTMDPPGEHRDSERGELVPEWRKDTEMLTGD